MIYDENSRILEKIGQRPGNSDKNLRKTANIIFTKVVQDRYGSIMAASGHEKGGFKQKKLDFVTEMCRPYFFGSDRRASLE